MSTFESVTFQIATADALRSSMDTGILQSYGAAMRKEEFYILELDEEFIIISISDRGAQVVKRGFNSRQEALDAFPQAA